LLDGNDGLAVLVLATAFGLGLPVILPMRNRGTRVCIFCSKFLTRALISETIWTPLLLDVVPVLVVEEVDALRKTLGRGMAGDRGGIRDGVFDSVGIVLDRASVLTEVGGVDRLGSNPARFKLLDWSVVILYVFC
jgi:hypothetical protein